MRKKGFKRKNLNYKKVGDSHCYDFMDYLFKIIKNIMFKSGFVNIDYLKVVYVLFLISNRFLMITFGAHVLIYMKQFWYSDI